MTPQQLKTMKLALEALKKCHYYMINAGLPNQSLLNEAFTAYKALEGLKEHAMRETQRLGQEIEQAPLAWPCLIDSADFSENTITLAMQCEDYKVSAGLHWLSKTPPKEKK